MAQPEPRETADNLNITYHPTKKNKRIIVIVLRFTDIIKKQQ
jgi:hypothetical protein